MNNEKFARKILDDFLGLPLLLLLFLSNPTRFPWFCFGRSLFPEENQQPVLGSWTWNKNTHFTYENQWKKSLRSALFNNNYSFRIINHSTTHNNNNNNNNTQQQDDHTHNKTTTHTTTQTTTTTIVPSGPLWWVEACSPPSRRPNPIPAIPPYVVRTPHLHGAPTTEETVKLWY